MRPFVILICFFISFSLLIFPACENDIATVNLITAASELPAESAQDVEVVYTDSAIVKLKLKGAEMNHYQRPVPYVEMPKGVQIEFLDEQGKTKTKLTANYAKRYEQEKKMEVKGNVIVVNEKGEKLKTEHLIWEEGKDLIHTEAFVTITTAEETLMGDGLEANQDFTRYKIKKPTGVISVDKHE